MQLLWLLCLDVLHEQQLLQAHQQEQQLHWDNQQVL